MRVNGLRFSVVFGLWSFLSGCAWINNNSSVEEVHVFSSFRGNGEDGLHLAYSHDGLFWQALKDDQSFLKPKVGGKLMRDPCIILGPDGLFHMVWTSGWQDNGIGIAHSADLITWSEQQFVPVMAGFSTARNAWAPEITWDPDKQHYLIYWASTIPGQYPQTEQRADKGWDHRIYATTTKNFVDYSQSQLFYQPDFNVIDATITQSAETYVMIVKDETRYPPAKNLKVAFSQNMGGPWQLKEDAFSPDQLWVEGPTVTHINGQYYVYFDAYIIHQYGAMRTTDFIEWQDVSDNLRLPEGTRHGSVFTVGKTIFDNLAALP